MPSVRSRLRGLGFRWRRGGLPRMPRPQTQTPAERAGQTDESGHLAADRVQSQAAAVWSQLLPAVKGYHRKILLTSGLTTFSAGHSPRLSEMIAWAALMAISSRDFTSTPAA